MIEVFILANGNSRIGLGHINRSLLIVDKLQSRNINCTYLCNDTDDLVVNKISEFAKIFKVISKTAVIEDSTIFVAEINLRKREGITPVLYIDSDDTSFYSEAFQKGVVDCGIKLMYATLYNQYHYYAHIVFNQNILALSQKYFGEDYCVKLLGPEYFIWPEKAKHIENKEPLSQLPPYNVFVNIGNADPNNVTQKVVEMLLNNQEWYKSVTVVVGSLYQSVERLNALIANNNRFELVVNSQNMYELMRNCDVAISSLGFTFWELTYMNIPSFVISGSLRERNVCNYLSSENYAIKLGDFEDQDFLSKWSESLKSSTISGELRKLKVSSLRNKINTNGLNLLVDSMTRLG